MSGILALLNFNSPLGFLLIIILISVLIFEMMMFISVIRNKFIPINTKILWVVGMLLIHPFVAILYFFTDHRETL